LLNRHRAFINLYQYIFNLFFHIATAFIILPL
jgi:hypothetical protein